MLQSIVVIDFKGKREEVPMAIPLGPKQIVSFEELLMSQVVQQQALTRLLVEKGIFTEEEFLEVVKAVHKEMKNRKRSD